MSRDGMPEAGWYPDAARPGIARWWDGSAWTDHSALIDAASTDVVSNATTPLSRRERRALDEHARAGSPPAVPAAPIVPAPFAGPSSSTGDSAVTPEPVEAAAWTPLPALAAPAEAAMAAPSVSGSPAPTVAVAPGWSSLPDTADGGPAPDAAPVDYAPLTRATPPSASTARLLPLPILPTATVGAWALALLPLVIAAALTGIVLRVVIPDPTAVLVTGAALLAFGGIGVGALIWTTVFAVLDRRRLRVLGHIRRPSVLWAVALGPLPYLVARVVALRDSGRRAGAPLVAHVIALVLVGVGAGIGAGVAASAASPAAVSPIGTIETSLEASLSQQGMPYAVTCPSGIELAQGTVMTCEARDGIGVAALVEVTITNDAGAFSYRIV